MKESSEWKSNKGQEFICDCKVHAIVRVSDIQDNPHKMFYNYLYEVCDFF